MPDKKYQIRNLIGLSGLILIVFGLAGCRAPVDVPIVEAPHGYVAGANVVDTTCGLIYEGKFDTASELIKQSGQGPGPQFNNLAGLTKIVDEYQAINQQRQLVREAAYQEQLTEVNKFRIVADSNHVTDVNDINNVSGVLLVIARACEFANETQKDALLSDSFVKGTFQKVKTKAAELESKGKWLDAYLICYSWLQAIYPDDQAYSDYAEQLIEKAGTEASFQDSPCESSKERFEGVRKEMFIKAVNALSFNYVSIIDYRQMTTKAVRRCELLAQVVGLSSALAPSLQGLTEGSSGKTAEAFFTRPDSRKLAAWSVGLTSIMAEVNQLPMGVSKDKFIEVFEKVLALNATTIQLPDRMLIAHFAEAALSSLDPYTVIVWPKQVQDFEKIMTNEFTGIGIEISKQKGLLTVASLLPDTPAYNSGLDAEDVIETVDGVQTKDMSLVCAVKKITGPAGTKVTLAIRRPGQTQTRDITITRAKITVPTIRGWQRTEAGKWLYMVDDLNKIGYVRVTNFSERTARDLEQVLTQLEAEGLRGLILDLRFNTGGLLNSAIEVTDDFIEEGLIVRTQPGFGSLPTYASARKAGTHPNYPMVVLINSDSASASEIVAGALADQQHKRAILVGERTHGKGSVQGITTNPGSGAQLKYTMAYYHLPSGQKVESQDATKKRGRKDWGVGPNVEVKLRSDELKKMIDVQRNNDVLVKVGHENGSTLLKKHSMEETLKADPQLAIGTLVVRTKLIQAANTGQAAVEH